MLLLRSFAWTWVVHSPDCQLADIRGGEGGVGGGRLSFINRVLSVDNSYYYDHLYSIMKTHYMVHVLVKPNLYPAHLSMVIDIMIALHVCIKTLTQPPTLTEMRLVI